METVDLHGFTYEGARKRLIRFVEKNFLNGEHLEVVTGNSQKMKDVARQVSEEYGITFSDEFCRKSVVILSF